MPLLRAKWVHKYKVDILKFWYKDNDRVFKSMIYHNSCNNANTANNANNHSVIGAYFVPGTILHALLKYHLISPLYQP